MNDFPPEIMKEILKHLNYIDIEAAYETCVYWRNIIDEYQIWLDTINLCGYFDVNRCCFVGDTSGMR